VAGAARAVDHTGASFVGDASPLFPLFARAGSALQRQLHDSRVEVVKEASRALCWLASSLGAVAEPLVDAVVPALARLEVIPNPPIAKTAGATLRHLFRTARSVQGMHALLQLADSGSSPQRAAATAQLAFCLQHASRFREALLQQHVPTSISAQILKALSTDRDAAVRAATRILYWRFQKLFPPLSHPLFQALPEAEQVVSD
jgi:hypothetical protein